MLWREEEVPARRMLPSLSLGSEKIPFSPGKSLPTEEFLTEVPRAYMQVQRIHQNTGRQPPSRKNEQLYLLNVLHVIFEPGTNIFGFKLRKKNSVVWVCVILRRRRPGRGREDMASDLRQTIHQYE